MGQKLSQLKNEVEHWQTLQAAVWSDLEVAQEFLPEADAELEKEFRQKLNSAKNKLAELELEIFFRGRHDSADAICSISAGAGGTDAQDWAEMLEKMLLRFAERKRFKVKLLDREKGHEAGIKSSTFAISGRNAYGFLKSEAGVHRLVRISPFDAEKMRHTSFALVDIIPDLGDASEIKIKDEDIRVDVFRASGHGGQSVNTTDSAVRIVHLPSGLAATCQNERSQTQNKAAALKILVARLLKKEEEERDREERRIRGEFKKAEWGSQIRSYVLHPYKLVKDHRTGIETQDVDSVLSGDLDLFTIAFVKWLVFGTSQKSF